MTIPFQIAIYDAVITKIVKVEPRDSVGSAEHSYNISRLSTQAS